jgi:two-component system, cell cycle response regulator CpdR
MARILLADDDAAARDLVQRALVGDGHDVVATHDGAEALEQLQGDGAGFELLISDVQMPGVDGIELIEKALAIAPKMRVILMSGFTDELDRAKHLKSKIAREISKPFTLEQVRGVVRAVLK